MGIADYAYAHVYYRAGTECEIKTPAYAGVFRNRFYLAGFFEYMNRAGTA